MPEKCLRPDTAYLLQILERIIGFETVAPPGSCYKEIVEYLLPIFEGMGFKTEKI